MKRQKWISWLYIILVALIFEVCLVSAGILIWARWNNYLTIPFFPRGLRGEEIIINQNEVPPDWVLASTPWQQPPQLITPLATYPPILSVTEVTTHSPTPWTNPPTGQIAFVCNDGRYDQICMLEVGGITVTRLTSQTASHLYPDWGPDGNLIIYSSNEDGNFELYSINPTNRKFPTQLTSNIGNIYSPAVSPNGNRIAFVNENNQQKNIWVMRADGSNPRPITDSGSDSSPAWSPSGEKIAFISNRNGIKRIYIMSSNGANPRLVNITKTPKIGDDVDWSPDGEWLVFSGGEDGNRNIFMVRIDGANLIQLTDVGDCFSPAFSPSGEWITFSAYLENKNEIFVMKADGSNRTQITYEGEANWLPSWGVVDQ